MKINEKPVIRIFLESHAPQLLDTSSKIISEIFSKEATRLIQLSA